jgi:uncharacterized protein
MAAGGDSGKAGFGAGRHAIEGMGRGGFLFGGTSHIGSILALPSGVHAWAPALAADVSPASLAPLLAEAADIEFLLLGTGQRFEPLAATVLAALREAGIRFEQMSTSSAAQTYNILLAEDRKVAAALIAVA